MKGGVLIRTTRIPATPTRRPGITERRLLAPGESPHQSLVLVDYEPGTEVEVHEVAVSESFFVIRGEFAVILGDGSTPRLGPGDVCHFAAGLAHGLRCLVGPGQILVVFAPGRAHHPAPGPGATA